jgi:hypothetical protein
MASSFSSFVFTFRGFMVSEVTTWLTVPSPDDEHGPVCGIRPDNRNLGGNLPQYHFGHHKSHTIWHAMELGSPLWRVGDCLNYGMTVVMVCCVIQSLNVDIFHHPAFYLFRSGDRILPIYWAQLNTLFTWRRRQDPITKTMKNAVFWDVTPRGSCKNRRFGGT